MTQSLLNQPDVGGDMAAPIACLPAGPVLPSVYIVHVRRTRCKACSHISEHPEVYALNHLRPRNGEGKLITNLVRVDEFKYNIPVRAMPIREVFVPACQECYDKTDLSKLPRLSETEEWQQTYERKKQIMQEARDAEAQKKNKPKPTTAEVLDLI